MKKLMKMILDRLAEPSTWLGGVTVAAAVGFSFEEWSVIAAGIAGFCGVAAMWTKDTKE